MSQSILQSYFADTRTVTVQFLLVGILVGGYSIILVDSDISFFDDYVLPDLSECHANNLSDHCKQVWDRLGCDAGDQMCIGNNYWAQVNKQAIGLGALLFFARLIPSFTAHFTQGRKITWVTFFEATWWAGMAIIIFLGGIIDYGYYTIRGEEVPQTLDWLNNVGFFEYTKSFTGDPLVVESMDLFLTMLLSVALIGIMYFIAIGAYKTTNLTRQLA